MTDTVFLDRSLGDLARSILRHHGWQEIARLQKLLESCPQLAELVRTLGRLQERDVRLASTDRNIPDVVRTSARRKLVAG